VSTRSGRALGYRQEFRTRSLEEIVATNEWFQSKTWDISYSTMIDHRAGAPKYCIT
jgi:hypothetical protein